MTVQILIEEDKRSCPISSIRLTGTTGLSDDDKIAEWSDGYRAIFSATLGS